MRARFESLQAGRAVAAVLVVAYHASGSICGDPRFWGIEPFAGFFGFGHAGVFFFFTLSGFIIAAAHSDELGRPDRLANYAMRRAIRVYPIYWLVLLPIVALYLAKPEFSKPELASRDVIANSFLLIGSNGHASLAVAWTLFHEILFYLLFGLAIAHRTLGITALSGWFALCLGKAILAPTLWPDFYPLAPINLLFAGGLLVFLAARSSTLPVPALLIALGSAAVLATGLAQVYGDLPTRLWLPLYGLGCTVTLAGIVGQEQQRSIRIPDWLLLLPAQVRTVVESTNFPPQSALLRGKQATTRPVFVLSATEARVRRPRAA